MFGLSMTELLVVLAVALLVIGPKQLPQVAKTLGKTLRDFRRATDDLRDTFEREVMDEPRPKLRPNPTAVAAKAPTLTAGDSNPMEQAHSANAQPKPPEGTAASDKGAADAKAGDASGSKDAADSKGVASSSNAASGSGDAGGSSGSSGAPETASATASSAASSAASPPADVEKASSFTPSAASTAPTATASASGPASTSADSGADRKVDGEAGNSEPSAPKQGGGAA